MTLRIGIDLDNTIICYDHAFIVAAREQRLIPAEFTGTKQQVRDYIRALPAQDGETLWQKLQGHVYGAGIAHARLFAGVKAFLEYAKKQGAAIYIVSHKTEFGHFDPKRINLRDAAKAFLQAQGIFDYLPQENLFFCTTRSEKIAKISALACDAFIDDLEEVFADPAFPRSVRKLLFTSIPPEKGQGFEQYSDWPQIEQSIFNDPTQIASALLRRKVDEVVRAGGGGNSRIYRVRAGKESYALKMYPTIDRDARDRLGVEKKALQFFERHGIANVPRWINDSPGYALLSWVEGELANPPAKGELEQAIRFIGDIKRLSQLPDAKELPAASEACISGSEIVRQIEERLHRLQEVAATEPALARFLDKAFMPAFHTARKTALARYATPLQSGTCLIPADFGFHNAIRGEGGTLTFIDFEYFGWDDPVKLTADFLLHPAMQLDAAQRKQFRTQMLATFADDPHFAARLQALTPLFALRWALILLNEFLPERWRGRAFAKGQDEWARAKERQLAKAEDMLKNTVKEESNA